MFFQNGVDLKVKMAIQIVAIDLPADMLLAINETEQELVSRI